MSWRPGGRCCPTRPAGPPGTTETLWEGAEARRGNVSELWTWLTRRELAAAEAAELFGDVRISTVRIEKEETPDEALAFVRTTSSYLRLDAGRRRRFEQRLTEAIARAGGVVRSTEHATLVSARVRDQGSSRPR